MSQESESPAPVHTTDESEASNQPPYGDDIPQEDAKTQPAPQESVSKTVLTPPRSDVIDGQTETVLTPPRSDVIDDHEEAVANKLRAAEKVSTRFQITAAEKKSHIEST